MTDCDCGLIGFIREVYPTSFIMIVLSITTALVVGFIKRPYIRMLERELERRSET